MLIDFIHSFGAGVCFAIGVCCGAFLAQLATRQSRKEFLEGCERTNADLNARLERQVAALLRIAAAAEGQRAEATSPATENQQ